MTQASKGMHLWTPDGNKWQTEIDILIADLRFRNQQLEEKLANARMNLALLLREIADLQHGLIFLRKSDAAVSVLEFHKMKRRITAVTQSRNEQSKRIPALQQSMAENDKEIKRLDLERIALRTQVIPIKDRR